MGGDNGQGRRGVPGDTEAERGVLAAMLLGIDPVIIDKITALIGPDDYFLPAHAYIHDAILATTAENGRADPILVAARLEQAGHAQLMPQAKGTRYLAEIVCDAPAVSSAEAWARLIQEHSTARRAVSLLHEASNQIVELVPPGAVLTTLTEQIGELATRRSAATLEAMEACRFLEVGADDASYDWVWPDYLEGGDRLMLTAGEGAGKSTLFRQWAVQLASGICPFTDATIPAARVLLIDTENSARQIRRKLGPLITTAGDRYTGLLSVISWSGGIDLTTPADRARLDLEVRAFRPDILIIGPVYKLAGGDPTREEASKPVAMTLDRIRNLYGCALLIEAHTPYAAGGHSREKRPYGWSGWSRWPEFGLWLGEEGPFERWRPDRDDRPWPKRLRRSSPWPWTVDSTAAGTWQGPTKCIDALRLLLFATPGKDWSFRQAATALRASGVGYRDQTVRDALAYLVADGTLTETTGAGGHTRYLHVVPDAAPDPDTLPIEDF